MNQQTLFIGYCHLEEWAQAVDKSRPILAIAYAKDLTSSKQFAGPGVATLGVEVAQHDADGHLHYCHIVSSKYATIFGETSSEEGKQMQAAGEAHQEMILSWLKRQGFTVRTGSYSRPADWTLTLGHADCVARYDKEAKRYVPLSEGGPTSP